MSPRSRFLVILVLTLLVICAAIGYMAERARHWHEQGWTGVMYLSGKASAPQAKMMGLGLYQVMLTVNGSPADGKLLYRDEVLTLNGIPRDDVKRLAALDARTRRGSVVVYRIRRGNRVMDVPLRFESPLRSGFVLVRHAVALIVALTFIALALLIVGRAPRDSRATVFFALALFSAVAILLSAATVYEQSNGRGIILSPFPALMTIYVVSIAAFAYPPLILHLCLIFPRRRPILEKNPRLLHWIYAVSMVGVLVLLFLMAFFSLIDWNDVEGSEHRVGPVVRPVFYALSAFCVLVGLNVLWAARREGVKRAIGARPFRVAGAIGTLPIALARGMTMLLSDRIAGLLVVLVIVAPMLVLATFPLFALAALIQSYREANAEEKRQVAWPLWGLLLAIGVKVLAVFVTGVLSLWLAFTHRDMIAWRETLQTLNLLPLLFTLAIPISFAVAIFKYRLMNIDLLIRKTVVYAILSGAIIVVYLGLVGGLGSFLVYAFGIENQTTMVIGSTLIVALLFVPLRNRLQTLIDRNLFRHRYEYPEVLNAIAEESRTSDDGTELLTSAAEKLQQALQNRAVVIFAERQDEYVAVAKVGVADSVLGRLRVNHKFAELLDRPFDPRRRTLPADATAALGRIEAVLVVPVGARGFIAAAPKLSGGEYDVEDIDFFRQVAEQLAHGLGRMRMEVEEADFDNARAIQQALLPREMPRVAKLDVSGVWQPARMMGGDYYDLLPLSESELAVCIGDVAGKGMPAALLMSGLQAAVRASASSSPRDLCERVRRVVVSTLTGGRFVTFFYATVDTAAMRLRWCNAGHNAPILARADGSIVRLSEGGPAFNRLFRGAYEEREMALAPGDRLVLFTDGVSEAMDGSGEMFGEERIEELVTDCRDLGATELQQTIVDAASAYTGGELEDDVTLVVARITE
jgi:serine phosphatase RsbU (regulator of sigma subunit)